MIVTNIGGERAYFHVGRKAPKGWRETAGAIHLGRGIWMIRVVPVDDAESGLDAGATGTTPR